MSDPYNQYNQQYSGGYAPPNQYGSPAPGQQYPPPQQQDYYNQNQHQQYPPQQQALPQGYYDQNQGYQPYGPPANGGFQIGQQTAPYSDPYAQQQ
jgi:hypothetical protein